MNYKKLDEKLKAQNIVLKNFFSDLDLSIKTVHGFRTAEKNDTLKVSDLEKISYKLGVPMAYWWEDDIDDILNEPIGRYDITTHERKIYLDTINHLNQRIKELEEKQEPGSHRKRDGTSG